MGIATKNRRKIKIGGRDFVWYVSDDYDSADMVLRVASLDKNFIVNYHLAQPDDTRHLIVLGKEFNGLLRSTYNWKRVICPKWEEDSVITPKSVRRLIEWCLVEKSELIEVDWIGKSIKEQYLK